MMVMQEDVGKLIGEGFSIWRNNLNLSIPFLLNAIFSILAIVPFLAAFLAVLGPIENISSLSSEEVLSKIMGSLALLISAFVLVVLVATLLSSFFTAGAIGMAREAMDTGKANARTMWSTGRRLFLKMFLLSILSGLIVLLGFVFLLPGILLLPGPSALLESSQATGLLIVGIISLILYALVVSLLLAVAPFTLVMEDLGPVKAIDNSINFFLSNKFDVFVIWIVVVAIALGLQMIASSATAVNPESVSFQPWTLLTGLVNLLVLAPLSTVWWTRLYMSRTGMLKNEGEKDPW